MPKAAYRDSYMNFFVVVVGSEADATTLASADANTGAGVATMLAWRIHKIELHTEARWSGYADGAWQLWALSTRKSLAAYPGLVDKGTLAIFQRHLTVFSTGESALESVQPYVQDFLPPMIVASPNFSAYWQSSTNGSGGQSPLEHYFRIGFTAEVLSESAYREVFETWNYAN